MRRFLKGDMHAGFSKEKYKVGYCADLYQYLRIFDAGSMG